MLIFKYQISVKPKTKIENATENMNQTIWKWRQFSCEIKMNVILLQQVAIVVVALIFDYFIRLPSHRQVGNWADLSHCNFRSRWSFIVQRFVMRSRTSYGMCALCNQRPYDLVWWATDLCWNSMLFYSLVWFYWC